MQPAQPPVPVAIGELVANKYRVERVLGHGGMGVVVAAMHEQLAQRVAIKMLLPEAEASPNGLARFTREARAAATIRGEHVARVLDVGELEGGAPYIVMEYLEGRDLAAVIAEKGTLPVEDAVAYILQACEAIAEAHAAGIVHRDLKPSNLFLTARPDGSAIVKVLDFGISKALLASGGDGLITTTSSFVGSPVYSPPEQLVHAHDVDSRADIWSLGTILFEALAGRTPFVGDSVMHIASRIFNEKPTPLGELRADLPPELCAVVMRCLAKLPDDRYSDVSELAQGLAPYAPTHSISVERITRIIAASLPPSKVQRALALADTAHDSPKHVSTDVPPLASARFPSAATSRRWMLWSVAAALAGGTLIGVVGFEQCAPRRTTASVGSPVIVTVPNVPVPASSETAQPEPIAASAASTPAASSEPAVSASAAATPRPTAAQTGQGGQNNSQNRKNPLSVRPK